jgi:hypothetical protein
MEFFNCPICKLLLPKRVSVPVLVNHQGRTVKVLICERCKEIKEKK